jgi:hypothetical protein
MWIQVIAVVLVLAFPGIAMWLPNWLEEAPPAAVYTPGSEDAVERDELEAGDTLKADMPAAPPASEATSSSSAGRSK